MPLMILEGEEECTQPLGGPLGLGMGLWGRVPRGVGA